jgi:hypothetical protein
MRGTLEATVVHHEKGELRYTLRIQDGELRYSERAATEPHARVRGPERAWIEAFGPTGSGSELDIEGDRNLARAVLDVIADRVSEEDRARHAA